MTYDVFISYRRKTGADDARLLQQALIRRGYNVFLDYDSIRDEKFDKKIFDAIEQAPVFILMLTEGSLDDCTKKSDWVRREIEHALRKNRKIVPVSTTPNVSFFPKKLPKALFSIKNIVISELNKASLFEESVDKIIMNRLPTDLQNKTNSDKILMVSAIFKFYSNENCHIFLDGNEIGNMKGMSEKPFCYSVKRKGTYRFTFINSITSETKVNGEYIDSDEEKIVKIKWEERKPFEADKECPEIIMISGDRYQVKFGGFSFDMIRVEGGQMKIGATKEQEDDAEQNEYPAHRIKLHTFYMARYPVTQNLWELVMGYTKASFKDNSIDSEDASNDNSSLSSTIAAYTDAVAGTVSDVTSGASPSAAATIGATLLPIGFSFLGGAGVVGAVAAGAIAKKVIDSKRSRKASSRMNVTSDKGQLPIESIDYNEACEFVRRLSQMTNIHFSLPTEDEWEYAARGGKKSRGYKYAGGNDIDEVAWYRDNSDGTTHPVGLKKPNELGLYDMSGNVCEWTKTPAHSYDKDIIPNKNCYIRRGGSWWHEEKNCRVSRRYSSNRSKKTSGLGLRVVIRDNII